MLVWLTPNKRHNRSSQQNVRIYCDRQASEASSQKLWTFTTSLIVRLKIHSTLPEVHGKEGF